MFDIPRTEATVLSLTFERQERVRRVANALEDYLEAEGNKDEAMFYGSPQVIPVPDELDPRVPRIIFGSRHGFSQILVSQMNIAFQVNYSPDWQIQPERHVDYVSARSSLLWGMLEVIGVKAASYAALTNVVKINFHGSTEDLIQHIRQHCGLVSNKRDVPVHTISERITEVIDNKFYFNSTLENYYTWSVSDPILESLRLPTQSATEKGISMNAELNDRHSYNEHPEYFCQKDTFDEIIQRGFQELSTKVSDIRKEIL